jgi:integrase/recombinase XerD
MEKVNSSLPSCSAVLWKWTPNKNNEFPVRLCVTFKKKRKYYPIAYNGEKLAVLEPDWNVINSAKAIRDERKREIRDLIVKYRNQVKTAIDRTTKNNRPFTWERFESEFLSNESGKGYLSVFYDHLESIRKENRIGTYIAYNNAFVQFKKFRKNKELSPFDLSVKMLKEFDDFLQTKKPACGKTTIAMYMRTLKVIYNICADKEPSLLENYPFARKQTDRNRYKIKSGSGHKGEALSIEQLQTFMSIKTELGFPDHESKLVWLFSFHCQGMNMKDICLLKYAGIKGEVIRYVRAKTQETESSEEIIEVPLTDSIRDIIRQIGNPDKRPTSYVFPIIPNGLASKVPKRIDRVKSTEERISDIIKQKTKVVNSWVKKLCKANGLPEVTTYWARHSYANLLKQSGESTEMIRELLGHGDIKTTENYLKRFDADQKRKANERIHSLLKAS